MITLQLIEHPHNPTRLLLNKREDAGPWTKAKTLKPEYFTRPLKTTLPDVDPLIVQGIKVVMSKPEGLDSWGDAATFLDTITDAEDYALQLGHDLDALLT